MILWRPHAVVVFSSHRGQVCSFILVCDFIVTICGDLNAEVKVSVNSS